MGNYNNDAARNFIITLSKCDPTKRSTCKSDEELKQFLKEKFIIVYENTWIYEPNEFQKRHRLKEVAKFQWHPIDANVNQETSLYFNMNEVIFQDSFFQFGFNEEESQEFFTITPHTVRPAVLNDNVIQQIRFEMNLDRTMYYRQVYSVLEYLGDVGGLNEALQFIIYGVLFFTRFQPINVILIRRLFSYEGENPTDTEGGS